MATAAGIAMPGAVFAADPVIPAATIAARARMRR